MHKVTIAVVDDHPLFRGGVVRCLADADDFEVIAEGGSGEDAVRIVDTMNPEILMLDLSMPAGGVSVVRSILDRHPDQKVIVLTVSESSEDVMAALNFGARGYVLKGVGSEALLQVLRGVGQGETYLSPTLAARLLTELTNGKRHFEESRLSLMTEKERTILARLAEGLSNKHIAIELNLQEKTIKHHVTRILAKLNVRNRTEAAVAFHRELQADSSKPSTVAPASA